MEPPSEIEVNHAITAKMRNLIVMVREAISTSESLLNRFNTNNSKMKAVQKFKSKLDMKRPSALSGVLGEGVRTLTTATLGSHSEPSLQRSKSTDLEDRRPVETALAAEGIHHDLNPRTANQLQSMSNRVSSSTTIVQSEHSTKQSTNDISDSDLPIPIVRRQESGEKGHAHDPLDEEPLFLGIGAGGDDTLSPPSPDIVAESPAATDFNVYETAYQEEVERIRAAQGRQATVYLNRRVDKKKEYRDDKNMVDAPNAEEVKSSLPHQGFKNFLDKARETSEDGHEGAQEAMKDKLGMLGIGSGGGRFSDIASKAMENTKALGRQMQDASADTLEGLLGKGAAKK